MINKSQTLSIVASGVLHTVLGVLLFANFDTTIKVQPMAAVEPKAPIIDAVAITETDLEKEVARLDAIDEQKKAKEKAQQQALKQKQRALERKRQQEQARLAKLKQERAQLKKEEQARERAHKEKVEKEKAALAKIQKEKENLLQEKARIEEEKKQAELAEKKRQAEESARLAKLKAEKELAAKKKREAEEKERQRLQAIETQRIITQQVQQFATIIQHKINQNWRQPLGMDLRNIKCELSVRLSESGDVLDARVVKSSGNLEFDRSSELAVKKASPLPLPEQAGAREKFMKFTFTFIPGGMA